MAKYTQENSSNPILDKFILKAQKEYSTFL